MAWTLPRTWVAGETVTAALMNVHVRDNLKALGDPWTAYTPAWTAVTTNPTLGNGTLTGKFMQVGKLVSFTIFLDFGSTTNKGSGEYRWTLPVNAVDPSPAPVGVGLFVAASIAARGRTARLFSVTTCVLSSEAGGVLDSTVAWAAGDKIRIQGSYQAA